MNSLLKRLLAVFLFATLFLFCPFQSSALSGPQVLEESPRPVDALTLPSVKRDRFVKVHEEQFESLHPRNFKPGIRPSLRVNLFDDVDYNLVAERSEIRAGGRMVVTGHLEGVPGSLAVLSHSKGMVTGILYVPGRGTFKILPAANGLHRVLEMDSEKGFSCAMDPKLPPTSDPRMQASLPQEGMPYLIPPNYPGGCNYALNPTVVDLLVVYTPPALAHMGSAQAMESLIDTVVFYNNMVYYNSGINVQLRLVYSGLIGYTAYSGIDEGNVLI